MDQLIHWLRQAADKMLAHLLSIEMLAQWGVIAAMFALAYAVSRKVEALISVAEDQQPRWMHVVLPPLESVVFPLISLMFLALAKTLGTQMAWPHGLIDVAVSLTMAWVVIRFFSTFIVRPYIARWVAIAVFGIAALDILGVLTPLTGWLEGIGFGIKDSYFSLLSLIKGMIALVVLLWLAFSLSRITERQLQRAHMLSPSMQVLLSKVVKILLLVTAFLIGLSAVGVDLTAFTVFSGAVGLGLGFGLQKVISNFISGIILLTDRSIKPGDVIAIEDTYGWVNSLNARHVSVLTRDGKEHLIPNEWLITERVENWSYSDNNVRIKIPVGVSYHADIHKALELLMQSADETPRVLKHPKPNALVREFGDSSVNLELRCWINDPVNGMGNIQSEVMLKIWDKFHANSIEIPFPQRDIHVKSMPEGLKAG